MWRLAMALLVSTMFLVQVADAQKAKAPRRDRNKITVEEIEEHPAIQNAYDAVTSLRPNWLRGRGPTTIMQGEIGIVIYRDGSKLGSPDEMRSIPRDAIEEMHFLSASEAASRYGMDHPSGVIEVITKRGG